MNPLIEEPNSNQPTKMMFKRHTNVPVVITAGLSLFLAGCAVGPNYKRPKINSPAKFRGQDSDSKDPQLESFASLPWWKVFRDREVQKLVQEALENNYDLQIAVTRVEQSWAIARQVRADIIPIIGPTFDASRSRSPEATTQLGTLSVKTGGNTSNLFDLGLSTSWEVDLWGRLRRANQAAYARYFATEEARRGVVITLIATVAQSYFQLRSLDEQLSISKRTAKSFKDSLELFQNQRDARLASDLEVERAMASYKGTLATIPEIERQITLVENQLSVLLGRNPSSIPRGAALSAQYVPPRVPAGIPSALLERRPDIRQAEMEVVATNAEIGVAIGNFLPRVDLSAGLGRQSSDLDMLTNGNASFWNVAASVTGPVFQGGRLLGILRQTEAAWEEAKLQYEKTALTAFQEVSDALTSRQKYARAINERKVQVTSLESAVELSRDRYIMGITSYFELLQAQQELFPAEISLAQARLDYLVSIIDLYRALGGGWFVGDVPPPVET